jgi:glycosyltransferase involved in cell wall biosynthesis
LDDEFVFYLIMGPEDPPAQLRDLYSVFHFDTPLIDKAGIGFSFKATREYLAQQRPEAIMNASQPFPLGLAVVALGRWYDVFTIIRVTEDYFAEGEIGTAWERKKRSVLHGMLFNAMYRTSDVAIPVGPNLAEKLVRHGFDPDRVHPLPQPFNPDLFSPLPSNGWRQLKKKLGLEPDRETILTVGRLGWGKGADRVLEITTRVHRESDAYQFCLVGDGGYADTFRRQFAPEDVFCAGYVPREQVHHYFKVADLLIHPSRRDALPNVILEALAAEVPVIAAPVGEIDNLVTMLSNDPDEYVQKILGEHWVLDELPEPLNSWEKQAKKYRFISGKTITS